MNLHKTVEKFSTETLTDPYTPGASFKGAIRPFTESTNSGPSSRRRVLETTPAVTMFSNYVIQHGNTVYVVGGKNIDNWRGQQIRIKYPILPCDTASRIATVMQILTATIPSRVVYAHPHYAKRAASADEDSEVDSRFYLYMSQAETISKGKIVVQGSRYYRVNSDPYLDGALFQVVEALQLEAPVQTLTYVKATGYNPATDTITNGTTASVTAFVEDAIFAYDHTSERHAQIEPGDRNITFTHTSAPVAGDTIGGYKILTIDAISGGFSCHCRKV